MGRYKKKVKCPECGKLLSPQGLSGHLRFAHQKRQPLRGKPSVLSKPAPVLVKPRQRAKTIQELINETEPSITEKSPCCSAALRDAQEVLGVRELALANTYICARCGEWYGYEPDGFLQVDKDGNRGVSHFKHLPQEPVE